ncbi:hypothetical protein [Bacillus wiedmannii]|uniref:hypothetical protein n=1 Tax=Bacillus wiedmannii TaxID=1890302 RepID=UPI000CD803BE|nr:hypothetical protein [Bacillus wiedmannii]MBG9828513.1 hypothetical protein [Bacillus wiedmannii]UOB95782.1 hypothetical protein BTI679_31260 [Bacillus wiedmannii]
MIIKSSKTIYLGNDTSIVHNYEGEKYISTKLLTPLGMHTLSTNSLRLQLLIEALKEGHNDSQGGKLV